MTEAEVFVGIDVSKAWLDVAVRPSGQAQRVENGAAGFVELLAFLSPLKPYLVVMEATGGYEMEAALALTAAAVPVAVVNPRQVRDFAKGTGRLAKTDALDAAVLAHFAQAVRPEPRPLSDEQARQLQESLVRRRQLIEMLGAERNRMALASAKMRHKLSEHIAWLKKELEETEKQLRSD